MTTVRPALERTQGPRNDTSARPLSRAEERCYADSMKRLAASLAVVAFALGASSCYSNPDRFNKKLAQEVCDWYFECFRSAAEAQYSSYDDCVDTNRDNLDDEEANCSYDADEARACMDWVKDQRNDCSMGLIEATFEFATQCDGVYTDCNGNALELDETGGYERLASYPTE